VLAAFPDAHAHDRPDRLAFVIEPTGLQVTYQQLSERSRQGARVLRGLGLARGAHLAILIENHPHFLEVAWAAQRAGLRYTAISSRLTATEVSYILDDTAAVALVSSQRCSAVAAEAAAGCDCALLSVDPPIDGFLDYETLRACEPTAPLADEAEGVDLLYSSGTTGRPKGVAAHLSLEPLGAAPPIAALLAGRWGFGADTVYLSPAPLYHAAPLRFNMAVHRFGGTSVVMERFDALLALELIERHRITHVQLVPTMLLRMLKLEPHERRRFDLSSLRAVIHAAAPCPPEAKEMAIGWLGPIVHEYYSATENYLFTAITSEESLERPGSVGRAILGTPHILDERGHELAPGGTGTIWSEGGAEFSYHRDPEKTAATHNALGWSTVGDVGHLDRDGYLYLDGRRADLILAGGVNIYPQEIENLLVTHPEVADVAVFGVPEDEFGEQILALVQPAGPLPADPELEDRLRTYCSESLADFKRPRQYRFVAEIGRLPTGKLPKHRLRTLHQIG
jgi:fatty-acyl-CoA synthase